MKKWMKKITALSVASMTVFGLGTMSLLNVKAASPVTNQTPATITTINLRQFLVMKSTAHVPASYGVYTITGGTAVSAKDNDGTYQVFSGTPTSDLTTSPVEGTPTVGTADATINKSPLTVKFTGAETPSSAAGTTTDALSNTSISDNVTLASGYSYVKMDVPVNFTGVTFKEPGIYRYVITLKDYHGYNQGGTGIDASFVIDNETKTLDVYVTTASDGSLKVSEYILRNDVTSTSPKLAGFVINYKTVDVDISEIVSGNQSRASQTFGGEVRLFYFPKGMTFDVTTTSTDKTNNTSGAITVDSTADITTLKYNLKQGEHYTIKDFPVGATLHCYINKTELSKTGYSISVNSEKSTASTSLNPSGTSEYYTYTGTVNLPTATEGTTVDVVFEYHKDGTIPTGIIVTVVPYATVAVAGFAGLIFLIRRKKLKEEKDNSGE